MNVSVMCENFEGEKLECTLLSCLHRPDEWIDLNKLRKIIILCESHYVTHIEFF